MDFLPRIQHDHVLQLAVLFAFLSLLYQIFKALTGPLSKIPGPWYTQWTDLAFKYTTIKGTKPKYIHALHQQYGPIVRLTPNEISVADTSATAQMYQYGKGEFRKAPWYKLLVPDQESVFSTLEVDMHRRHRRLLAAGMSESSLLMHQPVVDAKVRLVVRRMGEEMKRRGCTDVLHWFICMATDVIGELSFGEGFRMLETGETNQYLNDLKGVARNGGLRANFPFLYSLSKYIPIPMLWNSRLSRQRMMDYAEQSLRRHADLVEQDDEQKPTLLSKLYKAKDDDSLSFRELRDNAVTYIVAGSDTTANTLTYLVWSVCRNPEIKEKLLLELRKNLIGDNYGEKELSRLPYLNQIIEESLRLYSAVPGGLPRVVPNGGAQLVGHHVPGGVTVSVQSYTMHKNATIFPDPLEFVPERWENPTKEMKESFVAFGGGSRICIGLHLAKMELRLATARFFMTFPRARVSEREGFGEGDMVPEMYFLMTPVRHRCLIELF